MTKPIGITICILAGLAGYFVTNHDNQVEENEPQIQEIKTHKKHLKEKEKKAFKMSKVPRETPSIVEAEARLEEKKPRVNVEGEISSPTKESVDISEQTKVHNENIDELRKVSQSIEKNVLKKYTPFLMGLDDEKSLEVYEVLFDHHMNIFDKVATQKNIDMNAEKTARDNKIKELLNENEFKKYLLFLDLNFSQ
jgi:flagellar basal body rod protein FlgB